MLWTHFMDMHSGGGQKEPWAHIYIEAPEDEARAVFFHRFGHDPEHVTCDCCGDDYSISSGDSLAQLTGYHRNCRALETPRDPETGRYLNDDPILRAHYYLEEGEEPPTGYHVAPKLYSFGDYQSLDAYVQSAGVLVIRASDIKPEERR